MNSEKQSTNLQMILREVNRVGEGQKNVPKLRFKGYEDAWEQRKVSEITKFHKQGYYTTEEYNDNKKYYLLRGTDLTGNKLVLKDTPKINASEKDYDAFKTEIGDFLIVRSGNVGTYGIVDIDIPAIFGSYLIDFRFDTEKVTNEFFGYFYQSERFQSQLNKITQSSANININAENIKSTYISLPVLTEQKKISNIMSTLDNCITLHQRKYDALKTMKKTLLSKMFPKDGEDVPEIRFKGFTDAWEQRILMNILSEYTDEVNALENGYVRLGIRSHAKGTFHTFVQEGKELQTGKMYKVAANKFIVNITFAWEHAVAVTNQNDEGKIVSHRFPQFTISDDVIPDFFKYIILNKQFKYYLGLSSPGGAGRNRVLNIKEMLKYEVRIATESEQEQIYKILSGIDNLITLHQRKLDELKNMKKTLLQQMFV